MRILLVTHGLPPESVGGVEQHVDGLSRALAAAGHHVEIFARSSSGGAQGTTRTEQRDGLTITHVTYRWEGLTALRDLYHNPSTEQALRALLAERAFDVAHVHHLTGLSLGSIGVLRAAGVPVVLTLHDYWMMCPRGQMWHRHGHPCASVEPTQCATCLAPTFPQWLPADTATQLVAAVHDDARNTLAAVTRLITPSARTVPFFAALAVPTPRIHVVENAVDTEALGSLPPPPAEGPLRIGYLGTLIPSKGLDVLVAAYLRLPPGAATLSVHGNAVPYHGDEGFLTRVFQRLTPGCGVSYHGPYTTGDLPRLLESIDVLVAPALWHEAFGLTVREALAAGRPVVVSRIGGLQDAVAHGDEGLLVEPGDPAELARALGELAGDRARLRAMGARGRARTRGFGAMAAELVAHYRSAAGAQQP
ncbi:MAG: glycosyltransferase family 4 protein [Planctomycetes bacterium]|nr:glycosyltransferase family 4 protein [Planctomycetota bacterium]